MHKYLIDHLLNLILLKEKRDLAKIKFKKIKVAEIASVFLAFWSEITAVTEKIKSYLNCFDNQRWID